MRHDRPGTAGRRYGVSEKIAFKIYLALSFADTRPLRWLRKRMLRHILKSPLDGLVVDGSVVFTGIDRLTLGRNVSIHQWSYISADGGLSIGDDVAIGHRCSILTTNHRFDDPAVPIKFQPVDYKAVRIADNVWLGANVTILAGVELGPGTVVAAGAVVTRSFAEGRAVIGGMPAKVLRRY